MRGGVQLAVAVWATLLLAGRSSANFRCSDRTPEGRITAKSPVDNKFQLKISGSPSTYEPGEKYTVSLQGVRQSQVPQKFTGFFLTVDSSDSFYGNERGESHRRDVGTFHPMLGDALTQISEACPNAVTQTSSIYKSEVQVYWKAPPAGNGCVVFRATVVEDRFVWHMDDGQLTLTLCEDVQENINEQPDVLEKCCACDEAKYEVTFEGLWSRHTHPKDFPSNGWLTRFSDIIGASHTSDYRFWQYGGIASEGLRQVAESGSTRMLESELKSESEHIRTIIKARGISYPNVTGKTFAVFRVDRKHHLMSLVSMIDPSPDWIVGVSGLELCLRNCSWVEFKVLNLFPWDAGTDSGTTYISRDSPTSPHDPIRQITSKFPKDESNPFFDSTNAEMKPFARLYLTRQRLYEKSCADDSITVDEEDPQSDCAVGEWSDWEPCSVTCGRGVRYRQRSYVNQMLAEMKACSVKLTSKTTCYGKQKTCREGYYHFGLTNEDRESWSDDPMCQLTEWSDWSPCSSPCGQGVKTRSRKYKTQTVRKKCSLLPGAPELEQTDECLYQDDCDGEEHLEEEDMNDNCPMTEWSEWSPCTASCGRGSKIRTRLRVSSEEAVMSGSQDYINSEGEDPCLHVKTSQEVACDGDYPNCEMLLQQAKEICQMPQDPGPCRGYVERWFFDVKSETCRPFVFNGCRGNQNNFFSKEDCERTCSVLKDPLQPTQQDHFSGLKPGNQIIDLNGTYGVPSTAFTPMTIETIYGDAVNCEVSQWSRWSECSSSCGRGMKEKSRQILVSPRNGGRPCPRKLLKKKKCKIQNCDTMVKYPIRDSKETLPMWGGTNMTSNSEVHGEDGSDCVLSDWTPWSPCSASCGLSAAMQRTRNVIIPSGRKGRPCGHRIEIKPCNLLPCKY